MALCILCLIGIVLIVSPLMLVEIRDRTTGPARLFAEGLVVGLRTARVPQSQLRYIVPTCVAFSCLDVNS